MIVDTSAIMAILLEEPGWDQVMLTLDAADTLQMSSATFVELNLGDCFA